MGHGYQEAFWFPLTGRSLFMSIMMIGTTAATVSRINNGQVAVRRALLEAIHRETAGPVTPNDIIGQHPSSVG